MELICLQCGNTDFSGMDTSRPLTCPVPGCGWRFDPQDQKWTVLRDPVEAGQPAGMANAWLDGWEEDAGND